MKKSRLDRPGLKKAKEPAWVSDKAALQPRALSKKELDDLARNVKRGIRDTPAWKDLVRRFGKAEAERILKVALYSQHGIAGNADN